MFNIKVQQETVDPFIVFSWLEQFQKQKYYATLANLAEKPPLEVVLVLVEIIPLLKRLTLLFLMRWDLEFCQKGPISYIFARSWCGETRNSGRKVQSPIYLLDLDTLLTEYSWNPCDHVSKPHFYLLNTNSCWIFRFAFQY